MEEQLAEYRRCQKEKFRNIAQQSGNEHKAEAAKKSEAKSVKRRRNDEEYGLQHSGNEDEGEAAEVSEAKSNDDEYISNKLTLLSWNIDGLESSSLRLRTCSVADTIKEKHAAAVFLQEVVEDSLLILKKRLGSKYIVFEPPSNERIPYFCVIILDSSQMVAVTGSFKAYFFPNSMMGRHLLSLHATVVGHSEAQIGLMTCHLESMKEHKPERIKQFQCLMDEITKTVKDKYQQYIVTSVCGGDLNIRDAEVKAAGKPSDVVDIWTELGSPDSCKFTWDMLKNTNKQMEGSFKPRYRFDRLYFHHKASSANVTNHRWLPTRMQLIGTKKLPACDMYASDHFGLEVHLEKRDITKQWR